jgi:hypothetical protein
MRKVEDEFSTALQSSRPEKKHKVVREEEAKRKEEIKKSREIQVVENKEYSFGDKGSEWRMMKLKRIKEISTQDNRKLHEVALERLGTLEEYNKLQNEYEYLLNIGAVQGKNKHHMVQIQKFKNPEKINEIKEQKDTKQAPEQDVKEKQYALVDAEPIWTTDELNKLQSQILKQKLSRKPYEKLQDEYEFQKQRSMNTKRKKESIIECIYCDLNQPKLAIISQTDNTFICIPPVKQIVPYHCYIVPKSHEVSSLHLDEDVWEEVRNYMKSMVAMFDSMGLDCLFYEQVVLSEKPIRKAVKMKKQKTEAGSRDSEDGKGEEGLRDSEDRKFGDPQGIGKLIELQGTEKTILLNERMHGECTGHCVIEVIPIPKEYYPTLPRYFQQAFEDSEGEWTTHKKFIKTTREKSFRDTFVRELGYVHVWFGVYDGLGHVIEEPKEWVPWFVGEIIGSVLDLSVEYWRKPKLLESEQLHSKAQEFNAKFRKFDWTRML